MTESTVCIYCDEPCDQNPDRTVGTMMGPRYFHPECALREVLGGIGHQIAHDYWCTQMHDPDGGMSRHQSALMVAFMYEMMGDDLVTRSYASARDGGEVAPLVEDRWGVQVSDELSDEEWGAVVLAWAEQELPPEWPPPAGPASE